MKMSAKPYPDRVLAQRQDNPVMYGDVDFSIVPERLDAEATLDDERFAERRSAVKRVFDRPELLDVVHGYTMLGDRVADAYAALVPEYGFRKLGEMLDTACEKGVEAVDDAPPELVAFIRAMEDTPDWVDMDLVAEGAREERIPMATAVPYSIRGAFLATFLNKYAALPMTMTGTLSDEAAAKRVFETASFFSATTLPGALDRFGKGFQAAAKVRLMHSMVRFHLLRSGQAGTSRPTASRFRRSTRCRPGLIGVFFLSARLHPGRAGTEFNETREGGGGAVPLPLLPVGAARGSAGGGRLQEIVDLLIARHVTLREAYDDETCGALVRGTLEADLFDRSTLSGRMHSWLEDGLSRFVLIKSFLSGDAERAESIGIRFSAKDKLTAALALGVVTAKATFYRVGLGLPGLSGYVDDMLNARLAELLESYGHADFVTDPERYKVNAASQPRAHAVASAPAE